MAPIGPKMAPRWPKILFLEWLIITPWALHLARKALGVHRLSHEVSFRLHF